MSQIETAWFICSKCGGKFAKNSISEAYKAVYAVMNGHDEVGYACPTCGTPLKLAMWEMLTETFTQCLSRFEVTMLLRVSHSTPWTSDLTLNFFKNGRSHGQLELEILAKVLTAMCEKMFPSQSEPVKFKAKQFRDCKDDELHATINLQIARWNSEVDLTLFSGCPMASLSHYEKEQICEKIFLFLKASVNTKNIFMKHLKAQLDKRQEVEANR